MEINKFSALSPKQKEKALDEMAFCDWTAGTYLYSMLRTDDIDGLFGENPEILMLFEEDRLAAFCTYVQFDEIKSDDMKPWIGFVYTFPQYRGRRFSGELIEYAVSLAIKDGYEYVYISSEERGLYEKYGFEFIGEMPSIHDYITGVFRKRITKKEQ